MGEAKRKEQSKEEAFKEKPEMFIDLRDVVIGVSLKTNSDGKIQPGVLINPSLSRSILVQAFFDLENEFRGYIIHMDQESKKKAAGGIIKPGDNGGVNRIVSP